VLAQESLCALSCQRLHGISDMHSAKAQMHLKNEGQKCISKLVTWLPCYATPFFALQCG